MHAGLVGMILVAWAACAPPAPEHEPLPQDAPRVVFETSAGEIVVGLYADRAPGTVANFLSYVDEGFYDGTLIHRISPNIMIQGGGFLPGMVEKPTRSAIASEADNGLKHLRGTLAMARLEDPDSATSQFFFNLTDVPRFDYRPPVEYGYTVFGYVLEGMDVVDRIASVPTHEVQVEGGMLYRGVPVEDLVIRRARRAGVGR